MKKKIINNHFVDIDGNLFILPIPLDEWKNPINSQSGEGQIIINKEEDLLDEEN